MRVMNYEFIDQDATVTPALYVMLVSINFGRTTYVMHFRYSIDYLWH